MTTITEEKWNEIYDDIFRELWKYCPKNNVFMDEAKEIMEEIKKILVEEKVADAKNN